jgi:ABC-type glutathione transport system ATPase component
LADNLRDHSEPAQDKKQDARSGLRRFGRLAEVVNRSYAERTGQIDDKAQEDEMIRTQLRQIGVVAFIGSSGTGKSTRAIVVAQQNKIGYIIDD